MENKQQYDYIVIGSGFGGAVSALRLAQKGYRVAVLEMGKRYRNEDFPKTNWNLRKSIWMPRLGLYGIQMLSLLQHVLVLHGSGVGGGSLVYANQLIVPDDVIFSKKEWGSEGWKARLEPHYAEAKRMLGAVVSPGVGNADLVLREVGQELTGEDSFHINPVGVYFGEPEKTVPDPFFDGEGPQRTGCKLCGACMIGCPTGAKNTLDKNYLYLAEKLGVKIFAETEVTGVQPEADGSYSLTTRKSTGLRLQKQVFHAGGVFFSAGVMGTVKLLMECKQKGQLPGLSERLGDYVRTNSEAILAVDSNDKSRDWNDQTAITSGIYPDANTHIELVRYNKGSDVLFALATVLTDGGGRIPRQLRFLGNILRHPLQFLRSIWVFGKAERMTLILAMQSTENYLKLSIRRRWWRLGGRSLNSEMPPSQGKRIPSYIPVANEVARRMSKKMDGAPMGSWFEVLLDAPSTAHILGGCVMADSAENGVVDSAGRVFGYPNLFIADGSVVPVNLNVNPSLTITALAEHILSQVPARR